MDNKEMRQGSITSKPDHTWANYQASVRCTSGKLFPGQYYDAETKLHYNYFRDYDPSIGRYIESDPIGLRGGINTYVYVKNRPLYFIDPLGLRGGCPANMTPGAGGMCEFLPPGSNDNQECVTAECAAGTLPAIPDNRSFSQQACGQCKFTCNIGLTIASPLPTSVGNAIKFGGGAGAASAICSQQCSSECDDPCE